MLHKSSLTGTSPLPMNSRDTDGLRACQRGHAIEHARADGYPNYQKFRPQLGASGLTAAI